MTIFIPILFMSGILGKLLHELCRCYYYLYFTFGSYLDNHNSYVM
ncbi:hypothetical protein ABVF33_03570 [Candidatus Rickettsia barbariae]